jgi:hypothetical protein
MWLKKQASTERRQDTGGPETTDPAIRDATDATNALSADSSLQFEPILVKTEVEAVEYLRARGYIIALPYASLNGP